MPLVFRDLPFGRELGARRHFRDPILREIEFAVTVAPCLTELRALVQRFLRFNGREQSESSVGDARSLPPCVSAYIPGSSIPRAWTRTRSITQVSVRSSGSVYIHKLKLYGSQSRAVAPFPRGARPTFRNVLGNIYLKCLLPDSS